MAWCSHPSTTLDKGDCERQAGVATTSHRAPSDEHESFLITSSSLLFSDLSCDRIEDRTQAQTLSEVLAQLSQAPYRSPIGCAAESVRILYCTLQSRERTRRTNNIMIAEPVILLSSCCSRLAAAIDKYGILGLDRPERASTVHTTKSTRLLNTTGPYFVLRSIPYARQ